METFRVGCIGHFGEAGIPGAVAAIAETLQAMGVRTAMEGVKGYYPAFDITPPHLVSGVVTDLGIYSPYDLHRYFTDGSIGKDNLVI